MNTKKWIGEDNQLKLRDKVKKKKGKEKESAPWQRKGVN